jgi:trans-feruloyl-CoA hydratase/vanillin synthase
VRGCAGGNATSSTFEVNGSGQVEAKVDAVVRAPIHGLRPVVMAVAAECDACRRPTPAEAPKQAAQISAHRKSAPCLGWTQDDGDRSATIPIVDVVRFTFIMPALSPKTIRSLSMASIDISELARAADGQVLVEFDNGSAWVTINRPEKRNAISTALAAKRLVVLDSLETDDRCGVVVITGTGKAFHSGMDLKDFFRANDALPPEARRRISQMNNDWQWRRLLFYMKPTIAMVNGYCFGGGLNPVCACDLAIAAEEATFGVSEINWGILPAGNVLKLLSTVMSERDALYYSMTGKTFDGRQAAQMRLVTEAVPLAQLRARTSELARELLQKNPHALRALKHAYHRVRTMSWEDADDFLTTKQDQARFRDPTKGREKGMSQFLDEKSFRPGLETYRR